MNDASCIRLRFRLSSKSSAPIASVEQRVDTLRDDRQLVKGSIVCFHDSLSHDASSSSFFFAGMCQTAGIILYFISYRSFEYPESKKHKLWRKRWHEVSLSSSWVSYNPILTSQKSWLTLIQFTRRGEHAFPCRSLLNQSLQYSFITFPFFYHDQMIVPRSVFAKFHPWQ
jgi:hypothetical protein